jgi:hypothetical protein
MEVVKDRRGGSIGICGLADWSATVCEFTLHSSQNLTLESIQAKAARGGRRGWVVTCQPLTVSRKSLGRGAAAQAGVHATFLCACRCRNRASRDQFIIDETRHLLYCGLDISATAAFLRFSFLTEDEEEEATWSTSN